MSPYGWVVGAGTLLAFGLYAFRLRGRGFTPFLALWGLLLGGAMAVAGAKLGYLLLMWNQKGFDRAIGFSVDKLSVVCGGVALCCGVALTGRLAKPRAKGLDILDVFAPCGALLLCFIRAAEYFLDNHGAGTYLDDDHFLAQFPFAIQNEWGEWMAAVCTLEAFLALIIAVIFLARREKRGFSGKTFEQTALLLALSQIFCESLRNSGMRWGFVRVEQVLCAVIALGLIVVGCVKSRRDLPVWKRFLPLAASILCLAVMVGMEFALDKGLLWLTNKVFHVPAALDATNVPNNRGISYGIMLAALAVMFWMHRITVRRREQA